MIPFVVQATPATQQLGAWTISARATYVQVYSHCGAGICQGEMHWAPRLAAVLRNGRVASFVFPVGAEGD